MIPKMVTKLRDVCLEVLSINSPKYSAKNGNNIINTGPGNQHVGDNNSIFMSSENVIIDQKNWKNLIKAFDEEVIKRHINIIKEAKQRGIKESWPTQLKSFKDFFLKKFEQIKMHPADRKASEFMRVQEEFFNAFELFIESDEQKLFQDKTLLIQKDLIRLNSKQ